MIKSDIDLKELAYTKKHVRLSCCCVLLEPKCERFKLKLTIFFVACFYLLGVRGLRLKTATKFLNKRQRVGLGWTHL